MTPPLSVFVLISFFHRLPINTFARTKSNEAEAHVTLNHISRHSQLNCLCLSKHPTTDTALLFYLFFTPYLHLQTDIIPCTALKECATPILFSFWSLFHFRYVGTGSQERLFFFFFHFILPKCSFIWGWYCFVPQLVFLPLLVLKIPTDSSTGMLPLVTFILLEFAKRWPFIHSHLYVFVLNHIWWWIDWLGFDFGRVFLSMVNSQALTFTLLPTRISLSMSITV